MPMSNASTLTIDKDLHRRIKISAAIAGKPIHDYLNDVLQNVLVDTKNLK